MHLNNLKPENGSRKNAKRVGRGIGSGVGKTCGRGHKGQHSRAGASRKAGFEGGQMPLQRRVPKFGFVSRKSLVAAEIRLGELNKVDGELIDLETLRKSNLINATVKTVKVFLSGEIKKPVTLKGIKVTAGAKAAIAAAGGKVEE